MRPSLAALAVASALALCLARSPAAEAQVVGGAPLVCDTTASISISSSGNNEIVALTSGQTIRVCHYVFVAAGTVSVKWTRGTGTACGTGTADLTGAMDLVANAGVSTGSGVGTIIESTSGNALCLNLSAAVGVRGHVRYSKY